MQSFQEYTQWKEWRQEDFAVFDRKHAHSFQAEFKGCGLSPGERALTILDIGFGNGGFMGWCAANGHACRGVETNDMLLRWAREKGFQAYPSLREAIGEAGAGCFDLVTAFDVLEHIEQPQLQDLFREVNVLLRDGGLFVAKFPNGDSPFGLFFQHGDLSHRTVLGRNKIKALAAMSGFKVEAVRAPMFPWQGVGLLRRVKRVVGNGLRCAVEAVVRNLYTGANNPLCANYVTVLRKAREIEDTRE